MTISIITLWLFIIVFYTVIGTWGLFEKAGRKHYFEIGLKSEEPTLLKSKWLFLDVLTRMKDDRFRVITRRGHYKFTQDMLDDLNLDKVPIKLS